jgi:hypothetical protein
MRKSIEFIHFYFILAYSIQWQLTVFIMCVTNVNLIISLNIHFHKMWTSENSVYLKPNRELLQGVAPIHLGGSRRVVFAQNAFTFIVYV